MRTGTQMAGCVKEKEEERLLVASVKATSCRLERLRGYWLRTDLHQKTDNHGTQN